MKIVTVNVQPSVPVRDYDWCAYDSSTYDGAEDAGHQVVGWGPTEEAAVNDFNTQWQDEHDLIKEKTERRCFGAISRAPNDASKLRDPIGAWAGDDDGSEGMRAESAELDELQDAGYDEASERQGDLIAAFRAEY